MLIELQVARAIQDRQGMAVTVLKFWCREDKQEIQLPIFHKHSKETYGINALENEGVVKMEHRHNVIEYAAFVQRSLVFADALKLKGFDYHSLKKFDDLNYIKGLDHEWWLTRGRGYKDVLIFDSPYGTDQDVVSYGHDNKPTKDKWTSIWLPKHCDPYNPGVTNPRLTVHETSKVDLKSMVNALAEMRFKPTTTPEEVLALPDNIV